MLYATRPQTYFGVVNVIIASSLKLGIELQTICPTAIPQDRLHALLHRGFTKYPDTNPSAHLFKNLT